MKKLLFGALAVILAAGFTSCKDDNPTLYYSYGTVMPRASTQSEGALKIRKDAGTFLTVKGWEGGLKESDRVIVTYETVGKLVEDGDNTVKLWSIYHVLTKNPKLWSELAEDEAEDLKLGNDGLLAIDPWFGGEYLNVDFRMVFARNSSKAHFINLVADDVDYDAEDRTLTVHLRHNAYGEIPGSNHSLYWKEGMVSFNLVNLFEEMEIDEADYPKVVLKWEKYKNDSAAETETQTVELGTFVPWKIGKPVKKADVERTALSVE